MITADKIITIVSDYFNIDRYALVINNRNAEIVKARYLAMYFCRYYTENTFRMIGSYFEKDHATVSYSITAVENRRDTEKAYRHDFDNIKKTILKEIENNTYSQMRAESTIFQENDFYELITAKS